MKRTFGQVALLLILVIQLSGCAAVIIGGAAATGGLLYVRGKLQEDIKASTTRVHRASIAGLKELGLPLQKDRKDDVTARIKSEFADGKDISIHIDYISESTSRLTIRVGAFGDKKRSLKIRDSIHRHL
jgi:hypothetical protein